MGVLALRSLDEPYVLTANLLRYLLGRDDVGRGGMQNVWGIRRESKIDLSIQALLLTALKGDDSKSDEEDTEDKLPLLLVKD